MTKTFTLIDFQIIDKLKALLLCIALFLFSAYSSLAQVPAISYNTNPQTYTVGTAISPLVLTNSGGTGGANYAHVKAFAGSGERAITDGTGAAASFLSPMALTMSADNILYVSDNIGEAPGGRIRKVTSTGVTTTLLDNTGYPLMFGSVQGMAFDATGNLFVSDGNRIRKVTPAGVMTVFAGSTTAGFAEGTGTAARFNNIFDLVIDSHGNIYAIDVANFRVRKITPAGVVSTFAGNGNKAFSDGTGNTASFFYIGGGMTIDQNDNIYLTDGLTIRKITPAAVVNNFAGSPSGYGAVDAQGTSAKFALPTGITADSQGNIFVADQDNGRVRKITPAGIVTTVAGSATDSPEAVDGTGTAAKLRGPYDVAVDASGNLFFTEYATWKIRKITTTAYDISPALPAGLEFDITNGLISGTPAAASAAKDYLVTTYNSSGSSTATVNIKVETAAPKLLSLLLSNGILSPVFNKDSLNYKVTVPYSTNSITVTPAAKDAPTVVKVNGVTVTSGSASGPVSLNAGSNVITTTLTLGGITTTYKVNITRLPSDKTLTALTLSTGSLFSTDFSSAQKNYTVTVPNAVASIGVKPVLKDSTSTIQVRVNNGSYTAVANKSISALLPLNAGLNPINVFITGLDGSTETYTVTVTRSAVVTGAPVETLGKSGYDQTPAFTGQTRVGSVQTQSQLIISTLTSGLKFPWDLVFLPDGRMMVTEKAGTIRIVSKTGVVGPAITGVPSVKYQIDSGLLGLILDPDFATTRLVFWAFVEPVHGGYVTSVARARLSNNETAFENVTVIYRATPEYNGVLHPGSRMMFDASGYLFVTVGEHYDDEIRVQAQQVNSSIGKVVRIDKNGNPAPGNPFATTPGARTEIWTLGHRDPQGLAVNPVTGSLWGSDHGPMGGDELNIITPGSNYGWPLIAYGMENSGPRMGMTVGYGTQKEGLLQPKYYWDPAIAPSNIMFYTGDKVPEWKNNLFVAALKGKHVVRLIIENDVVVGEERLLVSQNERIRSVIQGPDGALYVITDTALGKIYRIVAASTNAYLKQLSLTGIQLTRVGSTNDYTASVSPSQMSVQQVAVPNDATATLKMNGQTAVSGTPLTLVLNATGPTTLTTVVTAQDGITKRTYTVTVNKTGSANASLNRFTLVGIPKTRIGDTDDYTATVTATQYSVQEIAGTIDPNATIKINGITTASGATSAPIALHTGANVITTLVTAEDGTTTRTYTITVTKAPSNIAALAQLSLPGIKLTRDGTTDNYTASVSPSLASVQQLAVTGEPNATLKVNGQTAISGTALTVALNATGATTITTVVTAEDGTTTRTFTITVNKTGSNIAALSRLSLLGYSLTRLGTTDNYTTTATLDKVNAQQIATAGDANATLKVNGQTAISGTAFTVAFNATAATTITTVVTAEDGITTRTFTITVNKPAPLAMAATTSKNLNIVKDEVKNNEDALQLTVHQGVSPNGDGANDKLVIDGITAYPENTLKVMNRNGDVIYQIAGYDNTGRVFDGHDSKGILQKAGTYFYSLEYKKDEETIRKTGYLIIKY